MMSYSQKNNDEREQSDVEIVDVTNAAGKDFAAQDQNVEVLISLPFDFFVQLLSSGKQQYDLQGNL